MWLCCLEKTYLKRVFNTMLTVIMTNKCFSGKKYKWLSRCWLIVFFFPDLQITYWLILFGEIWNDCSSHRFLDFLEIPRKTFYHTARTARPHSHNGTAFMKQNITTFLLSCWESFVPQTDFRVIRSSMFFNLPLSWALWA